MTPDREPCNCPSDDRVLIEIATVYFARQGTKLALQQVTSMQRQQLYAVLVLSSVMVPAGNFSVEFSQHRIPDITHIRLVELVVLTSRSFSDGVRRQQWR